MGCRPWGVGNFQGYGWVPRAQDHTLLHLTTPVSGHHLHNPPVSGELGRLGLWVFFANPGKVPQLRRQGLGARPHSPSTLDSSRTLSLSVSRQCHIPTSGFITCTSFS